MEQPSYYLIHHSNAANLLVKSVVCIFYLPNTNEVSTRERVERANRLSQEIGQAGPRKVRYKIIERQNLIQEQRKPSLEEINKLRAREVEERLFIRG